MADEELAKKIETYQELAKENPNVDVNLLMMNALETSNKETSQVKSHRFGYLVSIGLPPVGLILAAKYWMDGGEEEKQAAKICVLLTIVSIVVFFIFAKTLFSSSGVSTDQLKQLKPSEIRQELQ